MKKIIAFLVLALLLFIIIGFTVTRVFTKTILVDKNYNQLSTVFTNKNFVKKWYKPFMNSDTQNIKVIDNSVFYETGKNDTLSFNQKSYLDYVVKFKNGTEEKISLISLKPDTSKFKTHLNYSFDATLFDYWFGYTKKNKLLFENIKNLSSLCNDVKKYYGYEIEEQPVLDTTFIFLQTISDSLKVYETLKDNFIKIENFCKQNNITLSGTKIYNIAKENEKFVVSSSLGLSSAFDDSKLIAPFEFKRMPFKKLLLVLPFKGKPAETQTAVAALEVYAKDYNYVNRAMSFIKLTTGGYEIDANKIIQAQVCLPVQ